ncbi:MAG: VTC domain-containing protein [Bacteroidetes bacterium]|nr:MAG: VTC domain-containing protein [Bacteroidota bacterium]
MALQEIRDILENDFEKITLEEMDNVKLMDRVDMKFIFNESYLPGFLREVKDTYRALEVSGTRMSRYETLYYDTPGYDLYTKHHNGRLNRYKIRLRRYVESDLNFFEVKHKNNKARTVKKRVKKKDTDPQIEGKAETLLSESAQMQPHHLVPKLWVNYTRVTLVNRFEEERLTIDLDLEVKTEDGLSRQFDGLVIVEAKQGKAHRTPFVALLRKNYIAEGGMSKYCLAVYSLVNSVKKNSFKEDVNAIEKCCNKPE